MSREKIFYALESIVWYDGHDEWLKELRDNMENHLNSNEGWYSYPNPFDPSEWHTEAHTIYMLLVGMFGDWGTSIRSGWIEDIKGCIEFIDTIIRANEEEEGADDEQREADC